MSVTLQSPLQDAKDQDLALLPLCVDLDGTLVLSDTLIEGILAILVQPNGWKKLPALATFTRSSFKHRVTEAAVLDPALLPYNRALLDYLALQKALGRILVLATAANWRVAEAVAGHLGIFDAVLASDEAHNLKGAAKGEALAERFPAGFVYAGDSAADLAVWARARAAVVVNASPGLTAAAREIVPIEAQIVAAASPLRTALRAMRPHQWAKNLLVFVPILTAHAETQLELWGNALLAFVAFSLSASAIYLLNDLADLAADRAHPRKRHRPLASGAMRLTHALALAGGLLTAGIASAACAGIVPIVALYAAVSISYSAYLKRRPLVDVFVLAGLYTIRLVGGGVATGHPLTLWLFNVSTFLFLGLALVKRVGELMAVARSPGRTVARRGYRPSDTAMLQTFGCAAGFASCVMLALFVQADSTSIAYRSPFLLWGIVPLLLFWQCRLWLATTRGHMHDDPIVYAARDRVSWLVAACFVAIMIAAHHRF